MLLSSDPLLGPGAADWFFQRSPFRLSSRPGSPNQRSRPSSRAQSRGWCRGLPAELSPSFSAPDFRPSSAPHGLPNVRRGGSRSFETRDIDPRQGVPVAQVAAWASSSRRPQSSGGIPLPQKSPGGGGGKGGGTANGRALPPGKVELQPLSLQVSYPSRGARASPQAMSLHRMQAERAVVAPQGRPTLTMEKHQHAQVSIFQQPGSRSLKGGKDKTLSRQSGHTSQTLLQSSRDLPGSSRQSQDPKVSPSQPRQKPRASFVNRSTLPKASVVDTEQAAAEIEATTAAHQEITQVATSITGELEKLMGHLGMDWDDDAGDVDALKSLSAAVRGVNAGLDVVAEVGFSSPSAPSDQASYDDPTLERARKLTAALNQHFFEIKLAGEDFSAALQDPAPEQAALREISSVGQRVAQDMERLANQTWASKVWMGTMADDEEDFDALPAKIRTGPPPPADAAAPEVAANGGTAVAASAEVANRNSSKEASDAALQAFLDQQNHDDGEFSAAGVQRMQTAFRRFKVPDSMDLHRDAVVGLLDYLGHVLTSEEIVHPIIKEITSYDYLDFDEFLSFMSRFVPREKEEFGSVFHKYDEDSSGSIEVPELRKLLLDLGFIPLHGMIQEALAAADRSGNGELDFQEFVTFMAVYRRHEGFTTNDVNNVREIFDRFADAEESKLMADNLSDALVQIFGVHVAESAGAMQDQLKSGQGLQKASFMAPSGDAKAEGLTFGEFLIFARKTREVAFEQAKSDHPGLSGKSGAAAAMFDDCDEDKNGKISNPELRKTLKKMGYTPLKQNLDEFLLEVDKNQDNELDFSEFFDFILLFKAREGFRKQTAEEMKKLFTQFDSDGGGEMDALEVADLMRELGYSVSLEEIRGLVLQVDSSGNNALDLPEYMRLMRLYREQELSSIMLSFVEFAGSESGVVSGNTLRCTLEAVGYEFPTKLAKDRSKYDFDAFVGLVDRCRAEVVAREKKKAGFSDAKIERFEQLFSDFDKDRSGNIDAMELLGMLKMFSWEPKTRDEQQALTQKIDTAHLKAREAGAEQAEGSEGITFWSFVQLARILETEHDYAEEQKMTSLMVRLKFSQKEVEEFRVVYVDKKKAIADTDGEELDGLPRQAVRRLLYMIGIEVKGDKKTMLDDELDRLDCPDDGRLDFFGFLELMRFLLDSGWMDA